MDAAQTAETMMSPIKYPGKEMLVADALSRYSPLVSPEVALDIGNSPCPHHPEKKLEFQRTIQDDPLLCTLAEHNSWQDSLRISRMYPKLYALTTITVMS